MERISDGVIAMFEKHVHGMVEDAQVPVAAAFVLATPDTPKGEPYAVTLLPEPLHVGEGEIHVEFTTSNKDREIRGSEVTVFDNEGNPKLKVHRLPASGLRVAMACRILCCRFRRENRWGPDTITRGLRISDDSVRRGLHSAELARLLVVEREPGCKLAVSVLDLAAPEAGLKRRPLYGPIPWSRWLPASRLPGKSLQVASVCWLLAGWNRSAELELALESWAEFGLSRFSASRGLDTLERAELVSIGRMPGRSPVVTILDVEAEPGKCQIERDGA